MCVFFSLFGQNRIHSNRFDFTCVSNISIYNLRQITIYPCVNTSILIENWCEWYTITHQPSHMVLCNKAVKNTSKILQNILYGYDSINTYTPNTTHTKLISFFEFFLSILFVCMYCFVSCQCFTNIQTCQPTDLNRLTRSF